jgi:hypothetical protein
VKGTVNKGDVEFSAAFGLVKFELPGKYYFKVTHNGNPLDDDDKYYLLVEKEE